MKKSKFTEEQIAFALAGIEEHKYVSQKMLIYAEITIFRLKRKQSGKTLFQRKWWSVQGLNLRRPVCKTGSF